MIICSIGLVVEAYDPAPLHSWITRIRLATHPFLRADVLAG